ncbi:AraC family transcriptional regulator [Levilactobacillus brevis]|nr:AraC family transcriptional regulator [Levilactobacillus brevis]
MDRMIGLLPARLAEDSANSQIPELSEGWPLEATADEHYNFTDKMELQLLLSHIILDLYKGVKRTSHIKNLSTMQYAKMIRVYIKQTMQRQVDQAISSPDNITGLESGNVIADICSQLNLSIGYASRLFKTYYGSSPKSYLSDIKQEIAQQLLLKPQFNINQIGTILGYKNPANFSRQFKVWTGLSPKQFRMRKVSHFVDQRLFSENFNTFPKENINDEEFKKNFWKSI